MIVSAPQLQGTCAVPRPAGGSTYWYAIGGLPVQSEVRLPIPALAGQFPDEPAWVIRLAELREQAPIRQPAIRAAHGRPPVGLTDDISSAFLFHRDERGAWWWWESVGIFHVPADARVVEVCPEAGADERSLGLALTGPLSVFVLYKLGFPTLHASAVVTAAGTVAFLGTAGQGKSTMAAAFLRRGATLLADDMLPLRAERDGVYAVPGLPIMKVWRPTAETVLGIEAEALPVVSRSRDKRLLWLDVSTGLAGTSQKLKAIYLLDRYAPAAATAVTAGTTDETIVRRLDGRAGLTALMANLSCGAFLRPAESAGLLGLFTRLLAQAPIGMLRYPTGFEHQAAVCARILEDLRSR